jgi:drug/metabolite transporter (DMT)-like permease
MRRVLVVAFVLKGAAALAPAMNQPRRRRVGSSKSTRVWVGRPTLSFSSVDSSQEKAGVVEFDGSSSPLPPPSPPPPEVEGRPSPLRYAVLLSVPLIWGTYAPAVRFLYEQPVPMPGILFSTVYYIIALATLLGVSAAMPLINGPRSDSDGSAPPLLSDGGDAPAAAAAAAAAAERGVGSAGAELGAYLFFGNFFQVLGLQWTTADRGAFIVQLTTVLVPFLEASVFFANRALPLRTWGACLLAAFGVVVLSSESISFDAVAEQAGAAGLAETAAAVLASLRGDALVAVAAVFYSLHVIRLGSIAPNVSPLRLAVAKAGYETLYALVTLAVIAACSTDILALLNLPGGAAGAFPAVGGGEWLAAHFPPAADVETFAAAVAEGRVTPTEWSALSTAGLWCGVMTCAYTIWAQSFGQRDVRPAEANLIYTSQPIFSAIIASLLLGETLTSRGIAGGSIIIAALLLSIAPASLTGPDE